MCPMTGLVLLLIRSLSLIPLTPWLSAVTQTSDLYTADPWNEYSFRVRAVDMAGNTGIWSESVSTRSYGRLYIPLIQHSYQPPV